MNNKFWILLLLQGIAWAGMDNRASTEARTQALLQSLRTGCTLVSTQALLDTYSQKFNADGSCLRQDLVAILQNSSFGVPVRKRAFCSYADLVGDEVLDFESTIHPDESLRRTCLSVAIRQATDIDRALQQSRKWLLTKTDTETGFKELETIFCAWMDVYDYGSISSEQKSAIVKMFRAILDETESPLSIVSADVFLLEKDPEYTTSGLRAETIGKWMSRTNEAPVAFQERCSRYFLRAAKEANICPVSVPNPQTDAVEETNRTETNDLDHGNSPAPAETADATAPSTEADSREPHEKHPWWFVGLALVFGGFAWWRFHRKTKG